MEIVPARAAEGTIVPVESVPVGSVVSVSEQSSDIVGFSPDLLRLYYGTDKKSSTLWQGIPGSRPFQLGSFVHLFTTESRAVFADDEIRAAQVSLDGAPRYQFRPPLNTGVGCWQVGYSRTLRSSNGYRTETVRPCVPLSSSTSTTSAIRTDQPTNRILRRPVLSEL